LKKVDFRNISAANFSPKDRQHSASVYVSMLQH